jgi:2-(3-amino-3-carboxypropyl)histidine synthase
MKVLFVQAKAKKSVIGAISKALKGIPEKKIGIITTVQFADQLEKVKKTLEDNNKIAVIGKPSCTAVLPGQVLGCDVSAATSIENKVDCFLYIGTGEFHPLGLLAKTEKSIYVLNPFTNQLKEISPEEKQKLVKRKILKLAQFKDCKIIGIIVSTKPGQCNLQADPEKIKKKLEKQGKRVYLFIGDSITDAELQNFPKIDGWVNTACPRLADDTFSKPFVNAIDL